MAWTIDVAEPARRQLGKLDKQTAARIAKYLRDRVASLSDPRQLGKPLVGELSGYWRYRVGDYRVICELLDQQLIILVVEIGHRREVYR